MITVIESEQMLTEETFAILRNGTAETSEAQHSQKSQAFAKLRAEVDQNA